MKKFILLISAVVLIGLSNTANAQISVNVNINSQPAWGPSGYQYARYYYLPDLNIYYDVTNTLYYYLTGGRWMSSRALPSRYGRYDLYKMYKVVINKPRPWMHHHTYVQEYARFRGNRNQVPIRDYNNNRNMQRGGSNGTNGRQQSVDRQRQSNNRQQSNHKHQSNNGQQSNDRQQDQRRDQK